MEVCLNSLSSGQLASRSTTRSTVAVATARVALGRSMRRTNTAWSPAMNVGTPNTSWSATAALVLLADRLERRAGGDLGEHRVGVDALLAAARSRDDLVLRELAALRRGGRRRARGARRGTRRGTSRGRRCRPAAPAAPVPSSGSSHTRARPPRRGPGRARTARSVTSQSAPASEGGDARARGRCGRTGSGSRR